MIIGASGYIGKSLYTLAKELSVACGTSTTGTNNLIPLRLEVPDKFDYGFVQDSDTVLVAAAISAPDICSREHDRAWKVNVTGTSSFISRIIAKNARVIFFSSDTVYGERADELDETAVCNPLGDYAIMKHEIENRFIGNPGFKSIRLSYVFSTEDKFTKYLRGCAARSEDAEIFHPFYRAVIHRDDVVQGTIALAQRWDEFPQDVINFGGPNVISRIEYTEALRNTTLSTLRFRQIQPEPDFFANRPRVIQMKSPLLASLLGRPARSLREAAQLEFDQKNRCKA